MCILCTPPPPLEAEWIKREMAVLLDEQIQDALRDAGVDEPLITGEELQTWMAAEIRGYIGEPQGLHKHHYVVAPKTRSQRKKRKNRGIRFVCTSCGDAPMYPARHVRNVLTKGTAFHPETRRD